jgi:hypothetical protein
MAVVVVEPGASGLLQRTSFSVVASFLAMKTWQQQLQLH